ncbi:hypothetical protein A2331_00110 [Candidatus Falkowbacteria bacterium RIFOXYB2_FULL_34_18]|uniref:Uncharacterized protein n=1 Tax=Candidatus Falkowbacteria bacterium RIFOXYD2_FULL_34_120 TaxID=1798007 RepID=A0A1F5TS13_9BACT|nr:MAG: hypothetical protein A2331_00110 [Candidatus Falkowbacteria bacterium RIFOXYB2_FULL_34_18]OGF29772.1 MAG: hypothetical protein A2500_01240 [Candidatus Falkowbacteria bacterium RIFOXYC12_FULL_34_55]OGF37499.1 MAG: hypothetical protein A2466_00670 [Candidatus Falkowbacteria bacterium RIFOXYC2_FULL_34_220]OGF39209.1 MAG: hypothetical protein A2515_01180 [Candidatus Falkowbacteria bacterium RIFOXYD12_FULL_34_57]OGF41776.1 MAG: hypothetical protein A2531_05840 [Candidatus Falkowbacteria bact
MIKRIFLGGIIISAGLLLWSINGVSAATIGSVAAGGKWTATTTWEGRRRDIGEQKYQLLLSDRERRCIE